MGCFIRCFGGAKHRKRRRPVTRTPPPSLKTQLQIPANVDVPVLPELSLIDRSQAPKVADVSVEETGPQATEVADVSVEDTGEKDQPDSVSGGKKKVTFDLNVRTYEDLGKGSSDDEEKEAGEDEAMVQYVDESRAAPSSAAYPLNHRYQNCTGSDDEDGLDVEGDDGEEYEDCDLDDEDDETIIKGNEEESYESFFSLPLEKDRLSFKEVNSPSPKRVSSLEEESAVLLAKGNARDRSQYVHPVLNPVENLKQWKEVKERVVPLKNSQKENIDSGLGTEKITFSSEPFKRERHSSPRSSYATKQEVLVDASLSNWLVTPGNSPMRQAPAPQASSPLRSNSSCSREERPILGALTIEDLKQSSVNSSPRKSPSRSADDVPIVGTVGSYWSSQEEHSSSMRTPRSDTKGIPNTTSKYREDKAVSWISTPFEARLERALKDSDAAAAECELC